MKANLKRKMTIARELAAAGEKLTLDTLNWAIDDTSGTEQGKILKRALWAILRHDLDAVLARIARLRNQVAAEESNVRTDRRLKELNVDPEEVLNRGTH